MQKCASSQRPPRMDRRSAGKSAHTNHRIRRAQTKQPLCNQERLSKTPKESEELASLQPHRGKRQHLKASFVFDGLLIHFFLRNHQCDMALLLMKFFGDGQARKEVAACAATSDGYGIGMS